MTEPTESGGEGRRDRLQRAHQDEVDPSDLLERVRADRAKRLTASGMLLIGALVVVTTLVLIAALSGRAQPPVALTVVLGLSWLFVLATSTSRRQR